MEKKNLNTLIGQNLKTIREQRGLSLEKAAKQTGVSKPMLGQIERGVSNPTVSTLWKIATGLGVSFSTFLEGNGENITFVKKNELEPIVEDDGRYLVYPLFSMENGKPFETFSIELKPECHYISEAHPRGVQEQIWVDSGQFDLALDEHTYTIAAQEAVRFTADRTHIYQNPYEEICRATLIVYYPEP